MQSRNIMKNRVLGASALMLLLMGTSFNVAAFGTKDDQSPLPLKTEFERLDSDRDGKLTRDEAARDKDVGPAFDKADSNGDGILIVEEYSPFKSAIQQAYVERFVDDSTLTAKVKSELVKDSGMKGLNISVETHNGTVILSGFVETKQQITRAVQIASNINGVVSVKNALEIKG